MATPEALELVNLVNEAFARNELNSLNIDLYNSVTIQWAIIVLSTRHGQSLSRSMDCAKKCSYLQKRLDLLRQEEFAESGNRTTVRIYSMDL